MIIMADAQLHSEARLIVAIRRAGSGYAIFVVKIWMYQQGQCVMNGI